MHMADALLSPAVGGTAWAASAGLMAYSSRKLRRAMDDRRVPLMAVLGAFVFAAQMVNFSIPATGSSGHLSGGLILAVLLGPYAGFLVLSSVLTIQALFFADGGLLALGCNIFNLGFFTCFAAYPLLYRKMAGDHRHRWRVTAAALAAAILGLQLGSASVVAETWLSGIAELPFLTFLLVMQPIHLAIGIVEGLATAAVVLFVMRARPEVLDGLQSPSSRGTPPLRGLVLAFLAAALLLGVGLSWFASSHPDGLEWSLERIAGKNRPAATVGEVHRNLGELQDRTAVLPGYDLRTEQQQAGPSEEDGRTASGAGTAVSGLTGGVLTLLLAGAAALLLRQRRPGIGPGALPNRD